MGNADSKPDAVQETAMSPEKPVRMDQSNGTSPAHISPSTTQNEGIKLYEYIRGTTAGQWELVSEAARPVFYDQHEDNEGQPAHWCIEIDAANIDSELSDAFEFQDAERRCTFIADNKIWAMKFPTTASYRNFYGKYQDCLFENTFKMQHDYANVEKVRRGDAVEVNGQQRHRCWAKTRHRCLGRRQTPLPSNGWRTSTHRYATIGCASVCKTIAQDKRAPGEFKDRGTPIQTAKIHNVRMGAGANSYIIREGAVGVMRNVRGGVQDTGTSFSVTPVKGASLTPSRVLLAKGETQMNMLTPTRREAVFQTDIETGKVRCDHD